MDSGGGGSSWHLRQQRLQSLALCVWLPLLWLAVLAAHRLACSLLLHGQSLSLSVLQNQSKLSLSLALSLSLSVSIMMVDKKRNKKTAAS